MRDGSCYISAFSYWEVTIKSQKGMLDVGDLRIWWEETLDALSVEPLDFRPKHVAALSGLPLIHRDPFDRGLIAQALAENLTLLSPDDQIAQYAAGRFRLIR